MLASVVALGGVTAAIAGPPAKTKLVSKTSNGLPATGGDASISSSGRFVAFQSIADVLPGADGVVSVYVHDRKTKKTRLVSKTSGGEPTTGGNSELPSISGSGRFIAFQSNAPNLPGANGEFHVYVHDRKTGRTRLASKTSSGQPGVDGSFEPSISASGRWVGFSSDSDNLPGDDSSSNIYIHDRKSKKTRLVSKTSSGDPATGGSSYYASLSASGRYVAFESSATNLPGDDAVTDVYVRDRKRGKTRLVSKTSAGEPSDGPSGAPSISASGRLVAFESTAENLPGELAGSDVYLFDRKRHRTSLISVNSAGEQAAGSGSNASISGSGRYIAFQVNADNLPGAAATQDVYRRDRKRGKTRLVSQTSVGVPGDANSHDPAISRSGGGFVAFTSNATNFPGDPGSVYVRGPLN